MVFGQLCAPALIYIVFSITQITMDSLKGLHNVAMVKLFISILFTILLNHLCQRGLGIISWIIVFIPFMLMSLITAILLTMFGLDPETGKLKLDREKKQRELDAREKAILDYGMARSKDDYMKMLKQMGYNNIEIVEMSRHWQPTYDETESPTEAEKYRSGTTMNKLQSRILAEELYYIIRPSVNTNTINSGSLKDLAFTNGTMKDQFLNFCNVPIDTYTQDIYYNLNRLGVFLEADDEQPRLMRQAFESMKDWGSLRRYDGTFNQIQNAELQIYQEYRNQLTILSSDWINTLMERYNTRVKEELDTGKYSSRCEKINSQLDALASHKGLSYSEFSFDDFLSFDEDAMKYGSREATQGIPTTCTAEMKNLCKVEIGGKCRPCSEKETRMNGSKLEVLCPVKCDNSKTSFTDDNYLKCSACHLCAPHQDTGDGTIRGKWTSMDTIDASGRAISGKSSTTIPDSWDTVNRLDWWTRLFGKTHIDYYIKNEGSTVNPNRKCYVGGLPKEMSECDRLDSGDVYGTKTCDGDVDGSIDGVYIYTVNRINGEVKRGKPIWLEIKYAGTDIGKLNYGEAPLTTGDPRRNVILRAEFDPQEYNKLRQIGSNKKTQFEKNELGNAQLQSANIFNFEKKAGTREGYYLTKDGYRLFEVELAKGVSTIDGAFYLKEGVNYVGKNTGTGKMEATLPTLSSNALQFIKGGVPIFETNIFKKAYLGKLPSGEYTGEGGDELKNYEKDTPLHDIITTGVTSRDIPDDVKYLTEEAERISTNDRNLIIRKFETEKTLPLISELINFKDDGTFYKNNAQATGGINFQNAYNDFDVKNKWINNSDNDFFTTTKPDDYLILPYPTGNPLSLSQPLIIDFGQLVYINTMDIKSSHLMELSNNSLTNPPESGTGVDIDLIQTDFLNGSKIERKEDEKAKWCEQSCQHPEYDDIKDEDRESKIIGLGTQDIDGYSTTTKNNPNGSCVCYEKKDVDQSTNIGEITLYLGSIPGESHTGLITVKPLDVSNKHTIGKVGRIMKITPATGKKLNINDIKFTGFKYTEGSNYIFSLLPEKQRNRRL
jgi:hypothetical protein